MCMWTFNLSAKFKCAQLKFTVSEQASKHASIHMHVKSPNYNWGEHEHFSAVRYQKEKKFTYNTLYITYITQLCIIIVYVHDNVGETFFLSDI